MNTNSRKRLTAIAAAAGIGTATLGLIGSPVSADRPVELPDSMTFRAENPCTATPMDVTIDSVLRWHEHGDRFVAHVSRSGSTDDGYVMDHGVETAVSNDQVFRQALSEIFRNEDGSKFRVRGVFVANPDGVRVDQFTLRCLDR